MNSISTELFFNEAEFQILIPNTTKENEQDPLSIVQAKPREFAFYDEHLQVYLFANISKQKSGTGDEVREAIASFYNQLEITIDATITDNMPTPSLQRSSSINTQSAPTSPKISYQRRSQMNDVTTPFFTQAYNKSSSKHGELSVFEYNDSVCYLYPMVVPIVYVKTKSSSPLLSINCNIQYRPITLKQKVQPENSPTDEYDIDSFETINLLSGLSDDPVFSKQGDLVQRFVVENQARPTTGTPMAPPANNISNLQLSLKRAIKEALPLRSGLAVKMRTTNASVAEKMVMMSVELENPPETGCEFIVEKVDVQVSNAVVSVAFNHMSQIEFPIYLNRSDLIVFVYDVTLLDDGTVKPPTQPQRMFPSRRPLPQQQQQVPLEDKIQPQRVSIQIYSVPVIDGIRASTMRSKWNTMLDVSGIRQRREEISPLAEKFAGHTSLARSQSLTSGSPGARSIAGSPGDQQAHSSLEGVFGVKKANSIMSSPSKDLHIRRAAEREVMDGIVVSFTVPDKIQVGKKFLLHVFIVNRSKHTRRFQVMIPNRKRYPTEPLAIKTTLPPLPLESLPIDPYMNFLKQYFENETHEADIICLENNIKLSPLGPSTSQSIDIEFIAVKEKLHTIDLVQLVDSDTGFVTNLRHVLEIYVVSDIRTI
ncbi:uncharacterized protein RHIMIDRAFT_236859 [Rhizopus microsporus ATCC 52813]|uniref:Trafficking protein particle complex II-specific subunit 65 IgD3 domain-containing protein n=1 Tax=Rhizopus microsporus ATCC 52813 TaxID=1340429 RepID=A0A2G4SYG0_RHIZD|nr:uncharacterized protein RHIMIDRAFT_236859 [Rhizopus microsporus ATCC 52813]PHZ13811.1 hypothetical protein RHIMIDRAFT_236859 [Rhizopus microsporus ATCC 52813]